MKAMLYYEPGGREVLRYEDVPDPEPGPADVIVDVAATSLNRLDVVQRNGWFQMPGFTYPHIAGMDIAGVVSSGSRSSVSRWVTERSSILLWRVVRFKLAGHGDLYGGSTWSTCRGCTKVSSSRHTRISSAGRDAVGTAARPARRRPALWRLES